MAKVLETHSERIQALEQVKTIALVGASANPDRPSYQVMAFLIDQGYELFPVNPGLGGGKILGREVYAQLSDIPVQFDMVDVFRNSAAVDQVINDIEKLDFSPKLLWMQLGVINERSASRAIQLGINVVMDHCPMIELNEGGH